MNSITLQIIMFVFAFFMIYLIFLHWKKNEISGVTFGVWLFIWIAFLFLAAFQDLIKPLVQELSFYRLFDFVTVVVFIVLTYLTLENNIAIKKYERQVEELVRKVAIKGGLRINEKNKR